MDERLPLSVLLLARDEAARLDALLPSLAFAEETVVVLDSATLDASRAVAERHGARVFERRLDGFGEQRAFALAQCTRPWVLWIDADERLDAAAVASIRARVTGAAGPGASPAAGPGASAAAGFRIARVTYFLGRRIRFCGWQGETVLRLFRRERARFDPATVHEQVRIDGAVETLPGLIEHHSYADWAACRDKLVRYAAAGAESLRRAGRGATLLDVIARPPLRFLRMYVLQAGFLDGAAGVMVCALAAAQVFLKYGERWADGRRRGSGAPRP